MASLGGCDNALRCDVCGDPFGARTPIKFRTSITWDSNMKETGRYKKMVCGNTECAWVDIDRYLSKKKSIEETE